MSVNNITGVSRVEPTAVPARPTENAARSLSERSPSDTSQKFSDEQAPRRFPWLSWETRQLQVASKQPSPYGNIALLGKELDQKV